MYSEPILNDPDKPLVSVCIFNYNYGRYLRECVESVFAQTYDNIEICFSDNASPDDSWNIALEYSHKYPKIMTITRNRRNFGIEANWANCAVNIRGKYYMQLCSDDALMPNYIQICVDALEAYPNAGFAMVHRTIVNEHNQHIQEPPFYNQTCMIPGPEQAAVYMMAAVNPSVSQILYKKVATYGKSVGGDNVASRWYGARILDFNICCEYSIVYIKEPLLLHRLHSNNDSFGAADNLMEVIGPYVLQHQFAETASICGLKKVIDRLPQSMDKLSKLCLRYCLRSLCAQEENNALRYFHLSVAIDPSITTDSIFTELRKYWSAKTPQKREIIKRLQSNDNLMTRSVSYNPPPKSVPLNTNV